MKIVYIYRQPNPTAFSIEGVFRVISREMSTSGQEVVEYFLGGRGDIIGDIMNLRRLDADIYHITGDINYIALFLCGKKAVITVHDIGHYVHSLRGWRRHVYKWLWLKWPLRHAGRITAVSSLTRDHVVEHLDVDPASVAVVNNCHNPMFVPVTKTFNADCPRILQVGTKHYKNVPRLVRALEGMSCRLVLIGEIDAEIAAALRETGVAYENLVGISDAALHAEYAAADIVTFVSIGEGFGVPIIEAQAMAKPLVTANVEPMSSVAGPGACLATPTDVASIREGLLRIIGDARYRQEVVEAGLKNVERYSPATIAATYLNIYRSMST